jgi:replicative DNA helicase
VGFFSLEMSKNAIVQRLISARSGVSSQHLRGGHSISKMDLDRLGQAADDLKHAPIYIDDMPSMTVLNLRARARRMVAQHGVKVIMIDYLQLMTAPGAARESRQVEVSTISRGVKALARELNIPVICLAQLNRASEQRDGNRPRMADLRESGSIEQDADVILLLHREDYYHVQDEDWKMENPDKVGVAEIIVAKQRNGPTDIVKLKWDSKTTRFKNLDQHSQPPGGYPFDDYQTPSQAASRFPAGAGSAAVEAKPWTQAFTPPPFEADPAPAAPRPPTSAFGARPKTGPAENHRDGGGSDQRPDVFEGDESLEP